MFFPDVMLHLVERLQPRGFIFSADAEVSAHELSSQLDSARKDARRIAAVGRFLLRRLYRVPAAGKIAASLIDFELELDELDELDGLTRRMRRTFDLNGLHLTAKGLQYFACLDCDDRDAGELAEKADAFKELAAALRVATSRLRLKILGRAVGSGQEMHVYGSLCLVCGNPRELERLAAEIDRLGFRGTGLGHRLISNLKLNVPVGTVVKAARGHVYLQSVLLPTFARRPRSSAEPGDVRLYGFALNDLALPEPQEMAALPEALSWLDRHPDLDHTLRTLCAESMLRRGGRARRALCRQLGRLAIDGDATACPPELSPLHDRVDSTRNELERLRGDLRDLPTLRAQWSASRKERFRLRGALASRRILLDRAFGEYGKTLFFRHRHNVETDKGLREAFAEPLRLQHGMDRREREIEALQVQSEPGERLASLKRGSRALYLKGLSSLDRWLRLRHWREAGRRVFEDVPGASKLARARPAWIRVSVHHEKEQWLLARVTDEDATQASIQARVRAMAEGGKARPVPPWLTLEDDLGRRLEESERRLEAQLLELGEALAAAGLPPAEPWLAVAAAVSRLDDQAAALRRWLDRAQEEREQVATDSPPNPAEDPPSTVETDYIPSM